MAKKLEKQKPADKTVKASTIPAGVAARFVGTDIDDAFSEDGFWIVVNDDSAKDGRVTVISSDFKTHRAIDGDREVYRHELEVHIAPEVSK
jgi:hypothetical protein